MKINNNSLKGAFVSLSLAATVGGWFVLANNAQDADGVAANTIDFDSRTFGDLASVSDRSPIHQNRAPSSLLIPVERDLPRQMFQQQTAIDRATEPSSFTSRDSPVAPASELQASPKPLVLPSAGPTRPRLLDRPELFSPSQSLPTAPSRFDALQPLELKPIPQIRAPIEQPRRPVIRTRSSR